MKEITSGQIGYIKGLVRKTGGEIDTEQLKDLSYKEGDRMIKTLLAQLGQTENPSLKRQKKKVISMAMTIGWTKFDPIQNEDKIDMERLNKWCVHKGMYKQVLDAHTEKQIPYLVSQFQYGPFKHAMSKPA